MNKLIDTNIFIDSFRGKKRAQEFLDHTATVFCSVITVAELIQGSRNNKEKTVIEQSLQAVQIVPITTQTSKKMLELMSKYSLSHGLTIPDALIAASAIEENLALITANTKHFSFIKNLKVMKY